MKSNSSKIIIYGGWVAIPSGSIENETIQWKASPANLFICNDKIHSVQVVNQPSKAIPKWPQEEKEVKEKEHEKDIDVDFCDATDCLVAPGFIDAHTHLWTAILRGTMADASFLDYACQAPFVASSLVTPRQVYLGTLAGARELISNGVTAALDFSPPFNSQEHLKASIQALKDSGLRAISFLDMTPAMNPTSFPRQPTTPETLLTALEPISKPTEETTKQVIDNLKSLTSELVQLGVSMDGFGREPMEQTRQLVGYFKNGVKAIHAGTFITPPDALLESELLDDRSVIVHGNALEPKHLETIRQQRSLIASTPEAEQLIGLGPYSRHNKVALGSDSQAFCSNDPFVTMRMALTQQRQRVTQPARDNGHLPHPISPLCTTVLTQATLTALPLFSPNNHQPHCSMHAFSKQSRADLVVLDFTKPNLTACLDEKAAIASLATQASTANVRDVMIDGKWRKRNFELVDKDQADHCDMLKQSRKELICKMEEVDMDSLRAAFGPIFGVVDPKPPPA